MSSHTTKKMRDRMPKPSFNIDDPENINSFLAQMNSPEGPFLNEQSRNTTSELSPTADQDSDVPGGVLLVSLCFPRRSILRVVLRITQEQDIFVSNDPSQSCSASPARGTKAPPSTPATGPVLPAAGNPSLEPVVEDGSDILRTIAETSNLRLTDSIYAPKNYKRSRPNTTDTKYATMLARRAPIVSFSNSFAPLDEGKTAGSPGKKSEQEKQITKYQDEVIAKFVEEKFPEGKCDENVLVRCSLTVSFQSRNQSQRLNPFWLCRTLTPTLLLQSPLIRSLNQLSIHQKLQKK
jgi:hypothetical protein